MIYGKKLRVGAGLSSIGVGVRSTTHNGLKKDPFVYADNGKIYLIAECGGDISARVNVGGSLSSIFAPDSVNSSSLEVSLGVSKQMDVDKIFTKKKK